MKKELHEINVRHHLFLKRFVPTPKSFCLITPEMYVTKWFINNLSFLAQLLNFLGIDDRFYKIYDSISLRKLFI